MTRPDLKAMRARLELKEWRDRIGLTQKQLAASIGVTAPAIQHWESGRRDIPGWLRLALIGLEQELRNKKK